MHHGYLNFVKFLGAAQSLVENEDVNRTTGVSDLDIEIEEEDIFALAGNFDTTSGLLEKLQLIPAERGDVNRKVDRDGTQAGVAMALQFWQRRNPSTATYRLLLKIVESLRRGDTAAHIRDFITERYK